jgi:hypothetical protein
MSEQIAGGDSSEQWSHIERQTLIRETKDFIVCIDKKGEIYWETTPEYDEKRAPDRLAHNSILNDAALLEETPTEGLANDTIQQFLRLIGESIVCSFEHDYANARKMLIAAAQYIRARREETSRCWYLEASFIMTIPFALLGSFIWLWRSEAIVVLGVQGMWLVLATMAGALGALLSVITRTGKLKLDCSAGKWLHYLEGGSRIWAGVLSGFLVALAVRYEIILAPLARGEKMLGVMLIAGFIGGAGERLAKSIISKLEPVDVATGKGGCEETSGNVGNK